MMSKTGMPARAISVLLALTLACTMVPSTSIAFAAQSADTSTSAVEQSASDQADAAGESTEAGSAAEAAEGATEGGDSKSDAEAAASAAVNRVNKDVPVTSSTEAAEESSAAQTGAVSESAVAKDDIDMLTTSVNLAENAANAVLTSNGLTFALNEDGETVTLTGWTTPAPKGELTVPTQITSGTRTYQVTNIRSIKNLGGGVRPNCRI